MIPVLSHYPGSFAKLQWQPLGSAGGFSGAQLWRGKLNGEPLFALKAWPLGFTVERLGAVHRGMHAARTHDFVPKVIPTTSGRTLVEQNHRLWDMTAWLPGKADFSEQYTDAKLLASCEAIAQLHRLWAPHEPQFAPCPGVLRRLKLLNEFQPDEPLPTVADSGLRELLSDALPTLRRLVPLAIAELEPWRTRPGPVQLCHCDIWHDHMLFTGDRVTGVIDYGAMKLDHPAVDLARWLGDAVGEDRDRVRQGLTAYRDAGGPWNPDPEFVSLLDRTGVICAAIHWIQRLRTDHAANDLARVFGRLRKLAGRLNAMSLQSPTPAARIEL